MHVLLFTIYGISFIILFLPKKHCLKFHWYVLIMVLIRLRLTGYIQFHQLLLL
nr:MAG TPA: hypothetical protein [Caudoviricetes sp.]